MNLKQGKTASLSSTKIQRFARNEGYEFRGWTLYIPNLMKVENFSASRLNYLGPGSQIRTSLC